MAVLSDGDLHAASNQLKLDHAVWALRTLTPTLPKFGPDGKQNGVTSIAAEAAWNATNFARLSGQISGVLEAVKQLAKAQGKDIDLAAVKQAAKDGAAEALAEGVRVDVTVNGVATNG